MWGEARRGLPTALQKSAQSVSYAAASFRLFKKLEAGSGNLEENCKPLLPRPGVESGEVAAPISILFFHLVRDSAAALRR